RAQPMRVSSPKAIDELVASDPQLVTELYRSPGEYLGFQRGDRIVFDWQPNTPLPGRFKAASRGSRPPAVSRSTPAADFRRLSLADLSDMESAERVIAEGAWAVFEGADLDSLRFQLRSKGFQPIELEDGGGLFVTGITPAEAARLAPDRTVFTRFGEVTDVQLVDLDAEDLVNRLTN